MHANLKNIPVSNNSHDCHTVVTIKNSAIVGNVITRKAHWKRFW